MNPANGAGGTIKVWYKLIGANQPTKVFVSSTYDIDDLKRIIKQNNAISLSHCDAPRLLIYPPQWRDDGSSNGAGETEALDPGEDVPSNTTSKEPLIVMTPGSEMRIPTTPHGHVSHGNQTVPSSPMHTTHAVQPPPPPPPPPQTTTPIPIPIPIPNKEDTAPTPIPKTTPHIVTTNEKKDDDSIQTHESQSSKTTPSDTNTDTPKKESLSPETTKKRSKEDACRVARESRKKKKETRKQGGPKMEREARKGLRIEREVASLTARRRRIPNKRKRQSRDFLVPGENPTKDGDKSSSNGGGGSGSGRGKKESGEDRSRLKRSSLPPPDKDKRGKDQGLAEQSYVDEVLRRSRGEIAARIKLQREKEDSSDDDTDNMAGKALTVSNYVCHICHIRKPACLLFSCGMSQHSYCTMHCVTRLNIKIPSVGKYVEYDNCPICSLECSCSKCKRELTSMSHLLKRTCIKQGLGLKECKLNILESRSISFNKGSSGRRKRRRISLESTEKRHRGRLRKVLRGMPKKISDDESENESNKHNNNGSDNESNAESNDESNDESSYERTYDSDDESMDDINDNASSSRKNPTKDIPTNASRKEMSKSKPTEHDRQSDRKDSNKGVAAPENYINDRHETSRGASNVETPKINRSTESKPTSEVEAGKKTNSNVKYNKGEKTSDGPSPVETTPGKNVVSTHVVGQEDGNVDYCLICDKSGGLICCDKCPRAFHDVCLGIAGECLPDSWECPRCIIDEMVQEGDIKKGDKSIDMISKAFDHMEADVNDDDFSGKVMTLSKIHEMLEYLINFDFGYEFEKPVDFKTFPDYTQVVQRPIDFGTITAGLFNGLYCKRSKDSIKGMFRNDPTVTQMDMLIFEVLKDIERVYHNCFLYNVEASTVYRMAIVQQKRCHVVRKCSIDKQLNPYIYHQLEKFIQDCKVERETYNKSGEKSGEPGNMSASMLSTNSDQTSIQNHLVNNEKAIGVIDPVTNKLVKRYSSSSVANNALVMMFRNLGQSAKLFSDTYMDQIFTTSYRRPQQTIFGYRWLLVRDIINGGILATNGTVDYKDNHISNAPITKVCKISGSTLEEFHSIQDAYNDWLKMCENSSDIRVKDKESRNLHFFKKQYIHKNCTLNKMLWKAILPDDELKLNNAAIATDAVKKVATHSGKNPDAELKPYSALISEKNVVPIDSVAEKTSHDKLKVVAETIIKKWDRERDKAKANNGSPSTRVINNVEHVLMK